MTKYTEINGIQFETHKSKYAYKAVKRIKENYNGKDLYSYYEKPSAIKQEIWREWRIWAFETQCISQFEVCSGSCFKFAIHGIYYDLKTLKPLGFIYITKTYNRLYLI